MPARMPGSTPAARHTHGAIRLAERERHARPDPGAALARVVEQPREQDLVVGHALLAERGDHVQSVPPVGDVHASNNASCGGLTQVASAVRSSGATRARTCDRNWRTLLPHQDAEDGIGNGMQDAATDRLAAEHGMKNTAMRISRPYWVKDRAELPRRLARHEREQDRAAVERRDRDEVEQPEDDVAVHDENEGLPRRIGYSDSRPAGEDEAQRDRAPRRPAPGSRADPRRPRSPRRSGRAGSPG